MGILDGIRSYFRDDKPTQSERLEELTRQRRGDQFGDLPDEIEEMPPEDVADEFAQMEQETRLTFMRGELISQDKWNEMRSLIRNDSKQREFWGLDGTQTVFREGVEVCACHEEGLASRTETRGSQETIGQTYGESEGSKTEIGGKMGTKGGIGVPGVGNVNGTGEASAKRGRTQGETQQEMAQATDTTSTTRTFRACRVEPTNSTVSRRAFLRVGNFHMGQKYNRNKRNTQSTIDNWTSDTKSTSTQQRKRQKGINELQEGRDDLDDRIDELDEEIEVVNNRLEENDELLEQNKDNIAKGEGSVEGREYLLDERDKLTEKRTNIREKKNDLRTEKSGLQGRIEDHEDYEETQEETDTFESATQDSEENTTEDHAAEGENEEMTEATTEPNTPNQTTDTDTDTPEGDGGPPADDGGDDRGGESETDTVEESTTVEPGAEPAQATADAATDEADRSESESSDATEQTDASEANDEEEYANKGELYLDRYDPSNGQTGGFEKSK